MSCCFFTTFLSLHPLDQQVSLQHGGNDALQWSHGSALNQLLTVVQESTLVLLCFGFFPVKWM